MEKSKACLVFLPFVSDSVSFFSPQCVHLSCFYSLWYSPYSLKIFSPLYSFQFYLHICDVFSLFYEFCQLRLIFTGHISICFLSSCSSALQTSFAGTIAWLLVKSGPGYLSPAARWGQGCSSLVDVTALFLCHLWASSSIVLLRGFENLVFVFIIVKDA